MEKNKISIQEIFIGITALFLIMGFFVFLDRNATQASTPGGVEVGTTTATTVLIGSTTPVTIFGVTRNCSSRIITTSGQNIRFSIGSSSVAMPVMNGAGILQLASTTVDYPSQEYGCGIWTAVSYETSPSNASSTITTVETR